MQEILTFVDMASPLIIRILSALTVFSALVVLIFIYARRRNTGLSRDRITDSDMSERHFVIRYSKKALDSNFLMILLGVAFSIFMFIFSFGISQTERIIFSIVVAIVAIVSISGSIHTVRSALFRCTVRDGDFVCDTFHRGKKTFRLQDIQKIEVIYLGDSKHPHRVVLRSAQHELLAVNPFSIDHIGYELLINILKDTEIDGRQALPDGDEPVQEYLFLRKFGFSERILFVTQCLALLLGIAAFNMTEDASAPFAQAYKARDVLTGYYERTYNLFLVIVIIVAVMLVVNISIIFFQKRKGRHAKLHVWTAVISITVIAVILGLFAFTDNAELRKNVREDIEAIESGELIETTFLLHLSWENYYRTASLADVGGYHPLYVVRHDLHGRIYFPKSFSPERLREIARDEAYQISGAAEGTRLLLLTLTPNYQIVVDVVPITK